MNVLLLKLLHVRIHKYSIHDIILQRDKLGYKGKMYVFNEMLSFAATWIHLEGIMLSEISLTEKDKDCMIALVCEI